MDAPKIKSVEVAAARPEPADQRRLTHLQAIRQHGGYEAVIAGSVHAAR